MRIRGDASGLARLNRWEVRAVEGRRVAICLVAEGADHAPCRSEFVCSPDDAIGVACALVRGAALADAPPAGAEG